MRKLTPFLFLLVLSACKPWQQGRFSYTENGVQKSVPFVIPRGYAKQEQQVDSAGNTVRLFRYGGGSFFYIAHMADSGKPLLPIDTAANIPRVSLHNGSIIYKGMDESHRYWREVWQGPFRVGYGQVSPDREHKFDSATNYAVVWPLQ